MTASPPKGFIDPIDAFVERTYFFWLLDDYLSTEKIFIYFCAGAMFYLWWVFPVTKRRFPKLEDYTFHARIYFLLFTKILIVKTVIKAMFLPLYGDKIRLTVDESLIVFFGSLLLMAAVNEPSLKEMIRKYVADRHFDERKGKFGVFFERDDEPEGQAQHLPDDAATSAHTGSSTPPKATSAPPSP